MTKEEARGILDRYKNWNTGQKSISFAMDGLRTREDDLLDERRKLLIQATKTLQDE